MEHEHNNGVNLQHLATVGFISLFPGFRRFIGFISLLGLFVAGILGLVALATPDGVTVAVNLHPVCNRERYETASEMERNSTSWGRMVLYPIPGVNGRAEYVHEENGTGYCIIQHDPKTYTINGILKKRIYEVAATTDFLPPELKGSIEVASKEKPAMATLAIIIGCVSFVLIFGLWLPATLMAMAGRRLMRNIHDSAE